MRCYGFIAQSLDGYIAREDNDLDWLQSIQPEAGDGDFGYSEFFSDIDCIVMGRDTAEVVSRFDEWPYGNTPLVVLSYQWKNLPAKLGKKAVLMKGDPKTIVTALEKEGYNKLYIDGGYTLCSFIEAGELDDLIITTLPILLGKGIPLFRKLSKEQRLTLSSSRQYKSGLVQNRYKIHSSRGSNSKSG